MPIAPRIVDDELGIISCKLALFLLCWQRYIKAAKYYLHTIDSDRVEQVDNAVAAPEATARETRAIKQEYRPKPEARQQRRGRPAKDKEGSYEHLGKPKNERGGRSIASSLSNHQY